MLHYYIPREDLERAIGIENVPKFAIEQDILQLLEESGFFPETNIMLHSAGTGNSHGKAFVLLPNAQQAQKAVKELHNAVLFDKRVSVNLFLHSQSS